MTRRSASAPARWRRGVSTTGRRRRAELGGRSRRGVGTRGRPGTGLVTSTPRPRRGRHPAGRPAGWRQGTARREAGVAPASPRAPRAVTALTKGLAGQGGAADATGTGAPRGAEQRMQGLSVRRDAEALEPGLRRDDRGPRGPRPRHAAPRTPAPAAPDPSPTPRRCARPRQPPPSRWPSQPGPTTSTPASSAATSYRGTRTGTSGRQLRSTASPMQGDREALEAAHDRRS